VTLEAWLAFAGASVALLLIPGPTVLLVISNALSQGRRVAVATAAGVALGDAVAMTASLLGLGALVMASATLFTALKWAGALYLIYLGLRLLLSRAEPAPLPAADAGRGAAFRRAALVTVLNPKSIVFFMAFVPQFLDPAAALAPQFAVLVATFVGLAALNALAFALLADRLRDRIGRPSVTAALSRLGGGALVAMGTATLTLRRGTA
jgi:threonine/homoserine/homoserine lactone efflux protein